MRSWTSDTGRTVVLSPEGEWDIGRAPELRRELLAAVEQPELRLVVVDLDGVTFLDSTGLGVLVGATKRAAARGARLVLTRPTRSVAKTLQITGLDSLLPGDERVRTVT